MAEAPESQEGRRTYDSFRRWLVEHKLQTLGSLWASTIAASLAYNFSQQGMSTSVKVIHARLHAQALTLAALAGAAVVEYYDHKSGDKAKRMQKHFDQ